MRLKSIQFTRNPGRAKEWRLESMELDPVNLVVGRNASGKTQALGVIAALARLALGQARPRLEAGAFSATFAPDAESGIATYQYDLTFEGAAVARESLTVGRRAVIKRAGGSGTLTDAAGASREFTIAPDRLAIVEKRDAARQPEIEALAKWAEGVRRVDFSPTPQAGAGSARLRIGVEPAAEEPPSVCAVYQRALAEIGPAYHQRVLDDMRRVGYAIESLTVGPLTSLGPEASGAGAVCLRVKEPELAEPVEQPELSQGMSRSLALLARLNDFLMRKAVTLALIDDIGEGLDFERAREMVDLLMERARETNVQFVMSTNDRFVMNRVPLDMWTLLSRRDGVIKVYNHHNSPRIFEDFKFTGLSNFDFLSTDFIHTSQNESSLSESGQSEPSKFDA